MADSRDWSEWVQYAETDWRRGSRDVTEFPRGAGFDLHQSAEKYLKAILVHQKIEVPFSHDLQALLEIIDSGLAFDSREMLAAKLLTLVAPRGRYPGNFGEPTVPEAKALMEASGVLRGFARTKLNLVEES